MELTLPLVSQTISLYSSQATCLHFQTLKAAPFHSDFAQQFVMHPWRPPGFLAQFCPCQEALLPSLEGMIPEIQPAFLSPSAL